jgi:hypothetical protein
MRCASRCSQFRRFGLYRDARDGANGWFSEALGTHADAVLLAAADAVADRIAELMGEPRPSGVVIELRKVSA